MVPPSSVAICSSRATVVFSTFVSTVCVWLEVDSIERSMGRIIAVGRVVLGRRHRCRSAGRSNKGRLFFCAGPRRTTRILLLHHVTITAMTMMLMVIGMARTSAFSVRPWATSRPCRLWQNSRNGFATTTAASSSSSRATNNSRRIVLAAVVFFFPRRHDDDDLVTV